MLKIVHDKSLSKAATEYFRQPGQIFFSTSGLGLVTTACPVGLCCPLSYVQNYREILDKDPLSLQNKEKKHFVVLRARFCLSCEWDVCSRAPCITTRNIYYPLSFLFISSLYLTPCSYRANFYPDF